MAISGIGSNYGNVYGGTWAAQKSATARQTEPKDTAAAQAGNAKDAGEKAVSMKKKGSMDIWNLQFH